MGIGFGKWAAKKVAETITKVKPGTKFKGQSTVEAIKKKGKEFKKKKEKEEFRKSGFYKYFTNQ